MSEHNGNHLFVPIACKWLAPGADDDDDDCLHTFYLYMKCMKIFICVCVTYF